MPRRFSILLVRLSFAPDIMFPREDIIFRAVRFCCGFAAFLRSAAVPVHVFLCFDQFAGHRHNQLQRQSSLGGMSSTCITSLAAVVCIMALRAAGRCCFLAHYAATTCHGCSREVRFLLPSLEQSELSLPAGLVVLGVWENRCG